MGWEPHFVDDFLCLTVRVACETPPDLIDTKWGWVFFWALCFADIFVLVMLTSAIGGFVLRNIEMRSTERKLQSLISGADKSPSLTILLPCYLPNEQSIVMDTVTHIISRLQYGRPFTLLVCYNTPYPLPIEEDLARLDGQEYSAAAGGWVPAAPPPTDEEQWQLVPRDVGELEQPAAAASRAAANDGARAHANRLQVLKVQGSRSKAENLNAALELVDTENVMIYDADHHPDPDSLQLLTAHMSTFDCACVQGSTYLRRRRSLFDLYINSEFFVTHFVFFPAMQFLTSCGVFGGSNALWKLADLRGYGFRNDVQTEDIELSTRAMLRRVKIRFCPEARSGELPPATFLALYRQRLRWALGWDQVTIQHFRGIGTSDLSCREKAALYWILPMRWLLLFSATLNAVVTPVVGFGYKFETPGASLGLPIDGCITLAGTAFLVVSAVVLASAIIHEPPALWLAVLLFQVSGIMYVSWQLLLAVISLSKICIGADGGWIVTARASAASTGARHRSRGSSAVFSDGTSVVKDESQLGETSADDHEYVRLE